MHERFTPDAHVDKRCAKRTRMAREVHTRRTPGARKARAYCTGGAHNARKVHKLALKARARHTQGACEVCTGCK